MYLGKTNEIRKDNHEEKKEGIIVQLLVLAPTPLSFPSSNASFDWKANERNGNKDQHTISHEAWFELSLLSSLVYSFEN